jgi:hypothetical protein
MMEKVMIRKLSVSVSLLIPILLATVCLFPSSVDAGSVLMPQTGQTTCWNETGNTVACESSGQDGALQKGVAWPLPRFLRDGETIIDNLTGLIWSRDANLMQTIDPAFDTDGVPDGLVAWNNALAYIVKLNDPENPYLGHTDWRLPNIREIRSLTNYAEESPADWLATVEPGFVNVNEGYYWSSTTSALSRSATWTAAVWFGALAVKGKNDVHSVWPVRGGGAAGTITLPATGQQTCWDDHGNDKGCTFPVFTGQDGAFQKGEPWPSSRFIINNQTILDILTSLIWSRNANAPGPSASSPGICKSWQEALEHLRYLNQSRYLGYGDWRLPNIHELESLISYEVNYAPNSDRVLSVSEWLAAQGVDDVRPANYWSSSGVAMDPTYAWSVNLYAGYLDSADKTDVCGYVWPVRDGSYLIGDINGDLRVDMTDAVIGFQLLVRVVKYPVRAAYSSSGADVSGNGRVGLEEIIYVLQQTAEMN